MAKFQENYTVSKDSKDSWCLKNTLESDYDVHHTHLAIVGDEKSDFGGEIPFRNEVEQYASEKFGIPLLQFVFGGGPSLPSLQPLRFRSRSATWQPSAAHCTTPLLLLLLLWPLPLGPSSDTKSFAATLASSAMLHTPLSRRWACGNWTAGGVHLSKRRQMQARSRQQ